MSIAVVAGTIALVAIAILLAIGRFRSQIRLGNAAKQFEKSQRRLSTSLETFSEVVENVQNQSSLIAEEISKTQLTYRYPGPIVNVGCFYCGRSPQWQMTAVAGDAEAMYGIHRVLPTRERLERIQETLDLRTQPWDPISTDWNDEWAQEHAELDSLLVAN